MCQERELAMSEKFKISYISFQTEVQKKKVSYTFSYKEGKSFKLKYFLIIRIKCFFAFYNIFFYTQPVYFFHLLRNFCNNHDYIVACFLILL